MFVPTVLVVSTEADGVTGAMREATEQEIVRRR